MISHGAYLVTYRTCTSGSVIVDISRVTVGLGTISNPWRVRSLLADDVYTVSANNIISESYHANLSLEDAEMLYKSITGVNPNYLSNEKIVEGDGLV